MDLDCRGYLIWFCSDIIASIGFYFNILQTETNLTYIYFTTQ